MLACLTKFSEQLYKKGLLEEGDEQASIDYARNFFKNGASFELVRASIEHLTDEKLQEIYDEVMASKNKE